jgi:TRAP-type C4-dicarboxylate transport system permease small subunit
VTALAVLAGCWSIIAVYQQRSTTFGIPRWKRRAPIAIASAFYVALVVVALLGGSE